MRKIDKCHLAQTFWNGANKALCSAPPEARPGTSFLPSFHSESTRLPPAIIPPPFHSESTSIPQRIHPSSSCHRPASAMPPFCLPSASLLPPLCLASNHMQRAVSHHDKHLQNGGGTEKEGNQRQYRGKKDKKQGKKRQETLTPRIFGRKKSYGMNANRMYSKR